MSLRGSRWVVPRRWRRKSSLLRFKSIKLRFQGPQSVQNMNEGFVFPARGQWKHTTLSRNSTIACNKWHGLAHLLRRLGLPIITVYIESSTHSTTRPILITSGFPRTAGFAGLRSFLSAFRVFVSRWQESSYLSGCMLLNVSIIIAIVPWGRQVDIHRCPDS